MLGKSRSDLRWNDKISLSIFQGDNLLVPQETRLNEGAGTTASDPRKTRRIVLLKYQLGCQKILDYSILLIMQVSAQKQTETYWAAVPPSIKIISPVT